jgi:hypothetical protein
MTDFEQCLKRISEMKPNEEDQIIIAIIYSHQKESLRKAEKSREGMKKFGSCSKELEAILLSFYNERIRRLREFLTAIEVLAQKESFDLVIKFSLDGES